MALAACGRIGFTPSASLGSGDDGGGGDGGGIDAPAIPPSPHAFGASVVDTPGIAMQTSEGDGTHLVFVDNTPGMNGDLVIFREGDNTTTIKSYVSTDGGTTWTRYILAPSATVGINAMGGCQDTIAHAFHVSWLDTSNADQYARLVPTYTGGDITGFTIEANFALFDEGADSPGPRDLAEIVDGTGAHRLVFAGTGPKGGSSGIVKLAMTAPAIGLEPGGQNDWVKASDHTQANVNDQLLPNSYPTGDVTTTYMASVSSNLVGGVTTPIVVVLGLPVDKTLTAWTIAPTATADFTLGAPMMMSAQFGAGTGTRADASLSLANAPSGLTLIAYSAADGVHVASVDTAGTLTLDHAPQPTTSSAARHAVIATDSRSRPAVMYADGTGHIAATLLFEGAWLPTAPASAIATPAAAWSVSNVWRKGGVDAFGMYADGASTTFSAIAWE